jgi:hypothetical protein
MTYAQYIQKFTGNCGTLSQNPYGWFEFTLFASSNKEQTVEAEPEGKTFEAEHIISAVLDDFVVITNKTATAHYCSIPLSLFVLQYIDRR